MKIYTQKEITKIKNQCLNKIYYALKELHERDNADETGAVKDRHDELLDIALKHLNSSPRGNVYEWIKTADLEKHFLSNH